MPIEILVTAMFLLIQRKISQKGFLEVWNALGWGGTLLLAFLRWKMNVKLPVALPLLALCALLGCRIRTGREDHKRIFHFVVFFVVMMIPVTMLAYGNDMGYGETWYRYYLSYITAIFLFIAFYNIRIESKVLSMIGDASYSLYLMHGVVCEYFNSKGYASDMWIWDLFPLLLCVAALTIVSHFVVEKYIGMRLKKWIIDKTS